MDWDSEEEEPEDQQTRIITLNPERPRKEHHRPALLRQVEGPDPGQRFILDEAPIAVGRSSECDLTLPAKGISRKHMVLEWTHRGLRARDLDSRNGIYLNGLKVHSAILRHGDTLQLGSVIFVFQSESF